MAEMCYLLKSCPEKILQKRRHIVVGLLWAKRTVIPDAILKKKIIAMPGSYRNHESVLQICNNWNAATLTILTINFKVPENTYWFETDPNYETTRISWDLLKKIQRRLLRTATTRRLHTKIRRFHNLWAYNGHCGWQRRVIVIAWQSRRNRGVGWCLVYSKCYLYFLIRLPELARRQPCVTTRPTTKSC